MLGCDPFPTRGLPRRISRSMTHFGAAAPALPSHAEERVRGKAKNRLLPITLFGYLVRAIWVARGRKSDPRLAASFEAAGGLCCFAASRNRCQSALPDADRPAWSSLRAGCHSASMSFTLSVAGRASLRARRRPPTACSAQRSRCKTCQELTVAPDRFRFVVTAADLVAQPRRWVVPGCLHRTAATRPATTPRTHPLRRRHAAQGALA